MGWGESLNDWVIGYCSTVYTSAGEKEFGKNITTKYHSGWAFVYIYPIYGSWRHRHPLGWRLGWFPIIFVATPQRHCADTLVFPLLLWSDYTCNSQCDRLLALQRLQLVLVITTTSRRPEQFDMILRCSIALLKVKKSLNFETSTMSFCHIFIICQKYD